MTAGHATTPVVRCHEWRQKGGLSVGGRPMRPATRTVNSTRWNAERRRRGGPTFDSAAPMPGTLMTALLYIRFDLSPLRAFGAPRTVSREKLKRGDVVRKLRPRHEWTAWKKYMPVRMDVRHLGTGVEQNSTAAAVLLHAHCRPPIYHPPTHPPTLRYPTVPRERLNWLFRGVPFPPDLTLLRFAADHGHKICIALEEFKVAGNGRRYQLKLNMFYAVQGIIKRFLKYASFGLTLGLVGRFENPRWRPPNRRCEYLGFQTRYQRHGYVSTFIKCN